MLCTNLLKMFIESYSINMDTEGVIERIHINKVFVLSGLNLEKSEGFLFPGTRKTIHNNKMSVLSEF